MRPSIFPNLLDAAKRNFARGFADIALFEVGLQFQNVTPDGQAIIASGIRLGTQKTTAYDNGLFTQKPRIIDVMDAKNDVIAVLQSLGINKFEVSTNNLPIYYHPNRSGAIILGKTVLAYFGEIHPKIAAVFTLETKVAAFEVFLENIPLPRSKGASKSSLKTSDYQSVERDFAFIVDTNITAANIEKEINKADKNLITNVTIFDVYMGKGVEVDKKSVAIKVTLQSFEKTLSEQDISAVSTAIITAASKGFGGVLRQ
jgi:phenylalanyl-tRNA synthetase beta chain